MKVSFEGIGEVAATFHCEDVSKGSPVIIADYAKIKEAQDGDVLCGVALSAGDDYACVQIAGAVTLPFSGTAPAAGYAALVADGNGGVKIGGSRQYLVLELEDGEVTFII